MIGGLVGFVPESSQDVSASTQQSVKSTPCMLRNMVGSPEIDMELPLTINTRDGMREMSRLSSSSVGTDAHDSWTAASGDRVQALDVRQQVAASNPPTPVNPH